MQLIKVDDVISKIDEVISYVNERNQTERLLIKTPEIDDKFELTQLINDKDVIKWLSETLSLYTLSR